MRKKADICTLINYLKNITKYTQWQIGLPNENSSYNLL